MPDIKIQFQDVYNEEIIAGGVYNYSEITRLLFSLNNNYVVGTHDIVKSLLDSGTPEQFACLSAEDIVLSNIGPFAYFYYFLRELSGQRYRIVRDVRTAFMMGYFLQETLCAPLTRPGDLVLFPSQYIRELYQKLFPDSLNAENTRVCYPLTHFFPPSAQIGRKENKNEIVIGYCGSCTSHKNIFQVFDTFFELKKRDPHNKYKLHVCGAIDRIADNSALTLSKIKKAFRAHGVPMTTFKYYGKLSYENIWNFYREIDVLLFPSLSNTETFGRVILEASHAGVPVLAANYAAAPELVPRSNIISTQYDENKWFSMNDFFSFGHIDTREAAEKLLAIENARVVPVQRFEQYKKHHFLECLKKEEPKDLIQCSDFIRSFINSINVRDAIKPCRKEALEIIKDLVGFVAVFEKKSKLKKVRLLSTVLTRSSNRKRTLNAFLYNMVKGTGIINRAYMAREFANFMRFQPEVMAKTIAKSSLNNKEK